MSVSEKLGLEGVRRFLDSLFGEDVHAMRVLSMANATLGVLGSASLAVHAIGQGLAHARGLITKHAVKQVDRLLSNRGIEVWSYFAYWVPFVVGARTEIRVALDWTEFDADDQSTIALNMITRHGRATPLLWKTVRKSSLKGRRNEYEDDLLVRFKEVLPEGVKVTLVADRGFGDQKLFELLRHTLGFDFIIRIRGNITVTSASGEIRPAEQWIGNNGRARLLRNALLTHDHYPIPSVVCVHAKAMKEPWCLVSSHEQIMARPMIDAYAKRWSIEPGFRDCKDPRFGMGMSQVRLSSTERRDRLFLISAFAIALLTLLGSAGESLGYDRLLKSNTTKKRSHSLFRQGCMLYELIPNMPAQRLLPLMKRFSEMLDEHRALKEILGVL
jgi:Transposase DDE domain